MRAIPVPIEGGSMNKSVFILFFVLLLLAMLWPVVTIANRIEPYVLGLPFILFWFVLVLTLEFLGLVILYWLERRRRNG